MKITKHRLMFDFATKEAMVDFLQDVRNQFLMSEEKPQRPINARLTDALDDGGGIATYIVRHEDQIPERSRVFRKDDQ